MNTYTELIANTIAGAYPELSGWRVDYIEATGDFGFWYQGRILEITHEEVANSKFSTIVKKIGEFTNVAPVDPNMPGASTPAPSVDGLPANDISIEAPGG